MWNTINILFVTNIGAYFTYIPSQWDVSTINWLVGLFNLSVWRSWACPVQNTVLESSKIHTTTECPEHHRAWLGPKATLGAPLRKHTQQRAKNAPDSDKQREKQQVFLALGQIPCSQWRVPPGSYFLKQLKPLERKAQAGASLSWRTAACGEDPCWNKGEAWGGKSVRWTIKEQKGTIMDWPLLPFPMSLCCLILVEEVEELGKDWS